MVPPQGDRPLPPYQQITAHYRDLINRGDLVDGDRLPPVRQLETQWQVAHATAARAVATLRAEGLVRTGTGGTVVHVRRPAAPAQRPSRAGEPADLDAAVAVFHTVADLAALLSRLPADTPVQVADCLREDPRIHTTAGPVRLVYALEREDGPDKNKPAVVTLGAFYTLADRSVPDVTVPVSPYDRAVEAVHAADYDALFAAFRQMLHFVAGSIDGQEDAALYEEVIEDNPHLAARAELEAQLLREAAARLDTLRSHIDEQLGAPGESRPNR